MDILHEQHDLLRKTVNALNGWKSELHERQSCNEAMIDDLNSFVTFLQGYLQEFHEKTEEDVLFPKIKDYGFSLIANHGGIYIQSEHKQMNAIIQRIANGVQDGRITDIQEMVSIIDEFVALLASHSMKEDRILFPNILKKVPQNVLLEISEDMEQFVEQNKTKTDPLQQISRRLCDNYEKVQ